MKIQQVTTGGFITRDDGKFLILQRSPEEKFLPNYWEIPGGGAEYGETPQVALKREIQEECGLSVEVGAPVHVTHYFIDEVQRVMITFLCRMAGKGTVKLSPEHSDFAWVESNELADYKMTPMMQGIIRKVIGIIKSDDHKKR
jgi:8-oxo-dGTP diphosphatase